jgi:hypothetical protein
MPASSLSLPSTTGRSEPPASGSFLAAQISMPKVTVRDWESLRSTPVASPDRPYSWCSWRAGNLAQSRQGFEPLKVGTFPKGGPTRDWFLFSCFRLFIFLLSNRQAFRGSQFSTPIGRITGGRTQAGLRGGRLHGRGRAQQRFHQRTNAVHRRALRCHADEQLSLSPWV